MSTLTNVIAAYASATGTAYAGAANLAGYSIKVPVTGGTVVFRDGGASGPALLTLDYGAVALSSTALIPGNGIRFNSNVHATLPAGFTVTLFLG